MVVFRRHRRKSINDKVTSVFFTLIAIAMLSQIYAFMKVPDIHLTEKDIWEAHHLSLVPLPSSSNTATKTATKTSPDTTSSIISLIKKALGTNDLTSLVDISQIPSLTSIQHMYTATPHIYGLSTCPTFRSTTPKHLRLIAPAGAMNTGTNLLSSLLHRNCHVPSPSRNDPPKTRTPGIRFQVPWGKHHPPSYRNEHVASDQGRGVVQDDVLPVVVIKDPLTWLSSMCAHRYDTRLDGRRGGRWCERLVLGAEGVGVTIPYAKGDVHYDSWIALWNEYYREWVEVTSFPRILVRYEDLMFHAEETIKTVCECAGGEMKNDQFSYRESSAKGEIGTHKGGNGFVQAVIKYGNETFRESILTRDVDRVYYKNTVDKELMSIFGYSEV